MKKLFLLGFVGIMLFGCESEKSDKQEVAITMNFSSPKAILVKSIEKTANVQSGKQAIRSGEDELSELFQIDENGNITPLLADVKVKSVIPFSRGFLLKLSDNSWYCIYLTNIYFKLPDSFDASFIGENENGDVIFSDLSVIRKGQTTLTKIQSSLSNPYVQSISGNFAIVNGGGIFQIMNTVSGERYNVNGCNGPRMVALSKTKALVDDCQGTPLIDMTTGQRSAADIRMWNHEHIYLMNGAAILDQARGIQDVNLYGLCYVNINGVMSMLCNEGFKPGSSSCMNCGGDNLTLFKSGSYFVVRELDRISVVKFGNQTKKTILSGYNVISISVKNEKVFFVAEDKFGAKLTGEYSLVDDTIKILQTGVNYSKIFAIE